MRTVEIIYNEESGEIMVGLKPESPDPDGEDSHLAPAEDIDSALEVARDLLTVEDPNAELGLERGFNRVANREDFSAVDEDDYSSPGYGRYEDR